MTRKFALSIALSCAMPIGMTACALSPQTVFLQQAPPHIEQPMHSLVARDGNGRMLTVRPSLVGTSIYQLSEVQRYTRANVVHLTVELFLVIDGVEQPVLNDQSVPVAADIPLENIGDPLTFNNLRNDSTYRIRATAYSLAGVSPANIISDPGRSYLDVVVEEQDEINVGTVPVKLLDTLFGGTGTAGSIDVVNGRVIGTCPTEPPTSSNIILGNAVSYVQTLAGGSNPGNLDGLGSGASFDTPQGVCSDNGGDLVVADSLNGAIRIVDTSGHTSTLAGVAGTAGFLDGPASQALFNTPRATVVDSKGNVYVADTLNYRVRKIDINGAVSTLAGGATGPDPIMDGTGGFVKFHQPSALAIDRNDVLYVGDGQWLRKVGPDGTVVTIAGPDVTTLGASADIVQINALTFDSSGNLYFTDGNQIKELTNFGKIVSIAGDTAAGLVDGVGSVARFNQPYGIAVDGAGTLYVADAGNFKLRKIDTELNVTTIVGSTQGFVDGIPDVARFDGLSGLSIISSGLVVSTKHAVRLVSFQ